MSKSYYMIFFFIFIISKATDQLTIFDSYSVKEYNVDGVSTFLDTLNIKNGEITINGNCNINNNKFFNNKNNQMTINSDNFIIEGLPIANIGANYLALDENNNLSIVKNTVLLDIPLAANYNITYASNIIGKDDMPLKIGNQSSGQFFIGDTAQKTNNIIFNSYQTIIDTIDTIDNNPITISKSFISYNNLQIITNLNISGNILAEKIQINKDLIINNPIYFTEMIIQGNCTINNNNNLITIIPKDGDLNVKNNILIKGIPLYNNTQNTFTIFALDNNKNIYKTPLLNASAINAINQDLFFIANNTIVLGSSTANIELNGDMTILDSMTINTTKSAVNFDFPISFQVIDPKNISQLIFQDNLTINNIDNINNLFSASNNNSICNINQSNIKKNTEFKGDQIVFLNYNTMETHQGSRLVIDQNNCIGIEGLNNTNNQSLRIQNNINNKINKIKERIEKIKKNINMIQTSQSRVLEEEKSFYNYIKSEINNFLSK